MTNDPQQFDWVGARAACSIKSMFIRLHEGVVTDAEKATTLQPSPRPGYPKRTFETTPINSSGKLFSVFSNNNCEAPVQFALKDDRIEIQTPTALLSVTVSLDNQGKCKLRIDKAEFEEWQVRKLVLGDLFFVIPASPAL